MTSERKIQANRANARASTGPKTARGRATSARNALRHGLSLPVHADPALSEEVEALAHEIAGTDANAETRELARRVAEAQVDLRRVRYARHQLLSQTLSDPCYQWQLNVRDKAALMRCMRAVALRRSLGLNPPDTITDPAKILTIPQGPKKLAAILSQEVKHLLALDRYEQRALVRRKFAVRALDEHNL